MAASGTWSRHFLPLASFQKGDVQQPIDPSVAHRFGITTDQ
jgi:hypothetical protein